MDAEKLKQGNSLNRKIGIVEKSIIGLKYAVNENIEPRTMTICFNGVSNGSIEISEKHFKKLCEIALSLTLNDLQELKNEFDNL